MMPVTVDPNVIPLLQGVKPYLGSKGQNLADSVLSFLRLISSQAGQETLKVFSTSMNPEIGTQADGAWSLNYAFTLFLILLLLVLSSNVFVPCPAEDGELPAGGEPIGSPV